MEQKTIKYAPISTTLYVHMRKRIAELEKENESLKTDKDILDYQNRLLVEQNQKLERSIDALIGKV